MTMHTSTRIAEMSPHDPDFSATARESTYRYLASLADDEFAPLPSGTVREVMASGVVAAHDAARYSDIVAVLARTHVSAVPVLDQDRRVLGVLSVSDLLARLSDEHIGASAHHHPSRSVSTMTARELMTCPAVTVGLETTVVDALRISARRRVHMLPVVDADGVLAGIVTRGDLLQAFVQAAAAAGQG